MEILGESDQRVLEAGAFEVQEPGHRMPVRQEIARLVVPIGEYERRIDGAEDGAEGFRRRPEGGHPRPLGWLSAATSNCSRSVRRGIPRPSSPSDKGLVRAERRDIPPRRIRFDASRRSGDPMLNFCKSIPGSRLSRIIDPPEGFRAGPAGPWAPGGPICPGISRDRPPPRRSRGSAISGRRSPVARPAFAPPP